MSSEREGSLASSVVAVGLGGAGSAKMLESKTIKLDLEIVSRANRIKVMIAWGDVGLVLGGLL